ncbi:Strawberry notch helicase C domain [Trinorchestia longiramus]|nr:Strawberry notch helicase C domain [Trinorchestia longiramus]
MSDIDDNFSDFDENEDDPDQMPVPNEPSSLLTGFANVDSTLLAATTVKTPAGASISQRINISPVNSSLAFSNSRLTQGGTTNITRNNLVPNNTLGTTKSALTSSSLLNGVVLKSSNSSVSSVEPKLFHSLTLNGSVIRPSTNTVGNIVTTNNGGLVRPIVGNNVATISGALVRPTITNNLVTLNGGLIVKNSTTLGSLVRPSVVSNVTTVSGGLVKPPVGTVIRAITSTNGAVINGGVRLVRPGVTPAKGRKVIQLLGNASTGFRTATASPTVGSGQLIPRAPSPLVVKKIVSNARQPSVVRIPTTSSHLQVLYNTGESVSSPATLQEFNQPVRVMFDAPASLRHHAPLARVATPPSPAGEDLLSAVLSSTGILDDSSEDITESVPSSTSTPVSVRPQTVNRMVVVGNNSFVPDGTMGRSTIVRRVPVQPGNPTGPYNTQRLPHRTLPAALHDSVPLHAFMSKLDGTHASNPTALHTTMQLQLDDMEDDDNAMGIAETYAKYSLSKRCIIFDECHRAKNLCPVESGKPTKTGLTVLKLQNKLPRARIVYASATGASEPKNMAYMVRLGLWGVGTPFKSFPDFISTIEKRGVGAMELVAMDMKLRGMYIARQLSFAGVSFRIEEASLTSDFKALYNDSVRLWVRAKQSFTEAADLLTSEANAIKTMWGQFWSAHQRFFKYMCIASKVDAAVKLTCESLKHGRCVVIGLQSTGEARTQEQLEREDFELNEFVSSAKGVLEMLVEKHFPASNAERVEKVLALARKKTQTGVKRKRGGDKKKNKRPRTDLAAALDMDDSCASDSDVSIDDDEIDRLTSRFERNTEVSEENFLNNLMSKPARPSNTHTRPQPATATASAESSPNFQAAIDRARELRSNLLRQIKGLGKRLPPNTLDHLVDQLGGPEYVAEMTGRKKRLVQSESGNILCEARSEGEVNDLLNFNEKERFLNDEKKVAIISEAASSGISLHSDARVRNQRRRVHITLELPWSADRAIQQFGQLLSGSECCTAWPPAAMVCSVSCCLGLSFVLYGLQLPWSVRSVVVWVRVLYCMASSCSGLFGRTHRSNQVNAPEYVFLISELAGERRFASIVAKRLESMGALTHGDRRTADTRDLSSFNVDNSYGRDALERTLSAVMHSDPRILPPNYQGDFFSDVKESLVGCGLCTKDARGYYSLDKDATNVSKFLNRILGVPVDLQNALFQCFSNTLAAITAQVKKAGKFDTGILDLCVGSDSCKMLKVEKWSCRHSTGVASIALHALQVQRGMNFIQARNKANELYQNEEGFYLSKRVMKSRKAVLLAVLDPSISNTKRPKTEQLYSIYKPNLGLLSKQKRYSDLQLKFELATPETARRFWEEQYTTLANHCSHVYWTGSCPKAARNHKCDYGQRSRTYHVLCGSVLSVWSEIEDLLINDPLNSQLHRLQVVRFQTSDNLKYVGTLIPNNMARKVYDFLNYKYSSDKAQKSWSSENFFDSPPVEEEDDDIILLS